MMKVKKLFTLLMIIISLLMFYGSTVKAGWNEMDTKTLRDLNGIWGGSGTEVVVVGEEGTALRYNESGWQSFADVSSVIDFEDVWGSSGSDVFAVGLDGTILHYDGTTWETMNTGTTKTLFGIWGRSKREVFAVGSLGTILHYNGRKWKTMESGSIKTLSDIWGSSTTEVYAVGKGGTILHYSCAVVSIYGEGSKEVRVLRGVRDNILSNSPEGRELIRLYYQWSPVIVKAMKEDEGFKKKVKDMMDGVLLWIKGSGK